MTTRTRAAMAMAMALAAGCLLAPASAGAVPPVDCGGPDDPAFGAATVISGEVPVANEGGYLMIPFTVPVSTTGVRVRYCYDQPELRLPGLPISPSNTLDLGVYGPRPPGESLWGVDELRGWSGGAVSDATIAVNGFSSEQTYLAARKAHVHGRTTRAYEPGPIQPGLWAVELGLASISSQSEGDLDGKVAYRVEIETTASGDFSNRPYQRVPYRHEPARDAAGWYAGDLHVHGEMEPGNATMRQTFDFAFKPISSGGAGLDFVTLVDHNNTVAWGRIGSYQGDYPNRLISRGTEVTTYRGHYQNQSSALPVDYRSGPIYLRRDDGGLQQLRAAVPPSGRFAQIRAAEGWTQINHPTIFPSQVPGFSSFCRGCPWDYSDAETNYSRVDAIEIQTGPAGLKLPPLDPGPNPFTTLAIEFYERALGTGALIAAVGSSDSHQAGETGDAVNSVTSSPIGRATTVVFAGRLSESAIARGVASRHTYVKLFGNDGPDLRFTARVPGRSDPPAIIGDIVRAERATFTARVLGAASAPRTGPWVLQVVKDGRPLQSAPVMGNDFTLEFQSAGQGRYRLQLMRFGGAAAIEAVSSPIWLDTSAPGVGGGGGSGGGGGGGGTANRPCAKPIRGTARGERLRGTRRGDLIAGFGGRDRVRSFAGRDCIYGGAGADRLWPGRGADSVFAGAGADRVNSVAGGRDRLFCGRGFDRAVVGRSDRVRGCERVRRRGR